MRAIQDLHGQWGFMPESRPCWHVIEAKRLMELLRRAYGGENPDLIYIEEYVNAEREDIEP